MIFGLDPAVTTMITVIATGVGTVSVQLFREARNHRWEEKARVDLAAKLSADSAALALKLAADQAALALKLSTDQAEHDRLRREREAETARQLATELQHHREIVAIETARLSSQVVENTVLTKAGAAAAQRAYAEANSINTKIAALGLQHIELQSKASGVVDELSGIATSANMRSRRATDQQGIIDRIEANAAAIGALQSATPAPTTTETLKQIEANTGATAKALQDKPQ